MILVFGGRAQGKLDFARNYLEDDYIELPDLADFEDLMVHGDGGGIIGGFGLGLLVADCRRWLDRNLDLKEEDLYQALENLVFVLPERTILIVEDIGSGVVPLGAEERARREANGRVLQFLAQQAEAVYRLTAGIATELKGGIHELD